MLVFRNYSFRYEEREEFTLKNINLAINTGEFVLFTGRSGCGKTTLIRTLNGLIPHFYPGEIKGELLYDEKSLIDMKPVELAGQIGTVFQDPRSQFFMTDTTREIAFGCENMGMRKEETIEQIVKASDDLELSDYLNRSIFALSSGEKQQVAIGSVYALSPKVFIFDEPSANLDMRATAKLTRIMYALKEQGYTVIVAEHRFHYLRNLIDRVFWIENGEIKKEFSGDSFCNMEEVERISYGFRTAYPEEVGWKSELQRKAECSKENVIEVKKLGFSYATGEKVLDNISFQAKSGDIIGIMGENGAGKTTLISLMTGIKKEKEGEIFYNGKKVKPKQRRKLSYLVMQDADYQLFSSSVEEELSLGMNWDCGEKVARILESLGLSEYKESHPAALSGGQKQRVTIGAAIAKESPIVYFDEPTSGLDYDSMVRVSALIQSLAENGVIVFVVSHDAEFVKRTCTRVMELNKGYEEKRNKMFQKIFEYAGEHKKGIYKATIILILSVIMGVFPFAFAYQLIAPLVEGKTIGLTYGIIRIVGILVCLVLQAIFYAWGLSASHKAAYNTLLKLRISLQKRFENLPLGTIGEKGTGTIKKLFVDDVDSLELLLAHSLPEGMANVFVPIVVYLAMFVVDWKLALMSLASLPLSFAAMMIMYSMGMKYMGNYYQSGQIMNNTIIEYINGMEVVKVFNKDGESYEKFKNDIKKYRDYTLDWYKACWPWMALYNSLLPCTVILTLPLGSWFVLKGYSTLSDLILVLCLALSIGMPLLKALGFLPTMPQLDYKIAALEQVLAADDLRQTKDTFDGKDYSVVYENVNFGYQSVVQGLDGKAMTNVKDVLFNINLTMKEGTKTALVGESGSGKSTLAKLLVHFYDVTEGKITIGGQDITQMSLESLNEQISYVAQEQYLFNTSIIENIRIGKPGAKDEEVIEAAKKAQCMEFIEKLPQGMNTLAGDAGNKLSGGQKQRISLARAILKNAPIIVLDEATAYADPENEDKMEAAIAELVKGKTLLVIAHKLTSVMDADQIFVMDKGRLVASGKHEKLLLTCKEYRKLWNAGEYSAKWHVANGKEAQ